MLPTKSLPALILLANANPLASQQTALFLSGEGYLVYAVPSFEEARRVLHSVGPDLLIADIRLAAFNGLHLAAHSRFDHPSLPIIITHDSHDSVLDHEARRLGATFVVNPLDNPEFLTHLQSALGKYRRAQTVVRRWPRKHVSGVVEVRAAAGAARIVDVSYGGLRLAFQSPHGEPLETFDVTLPETGLALTAHRVWAGRAPDGEDTWCGAEIAAGGSTGRQWREIVDAIS